MQLLLLVTIWMYEVCRQSFRYICCRLQISRFKYPENRVRERKKEKFVSENLYVQIVLLRYVFSGFISLEIYCEEQCACKTLE